MFVAIGTENPVKIRAVKNGFQKVFPKEKLIFKFSHTASGVLAQPMSDKEGILGAKNRARKILLKFKADFNVGLEGSIEKINRDWFAGPWCVIIDKNNKQGIAGGVKIHIAPKVIRLIGQGHELGAADDILTGRKNTKQKEGCIGIMTGGILTREKIYQEAVIAALSRWIKPEFYGEKRN